MRLSSSEPVGCLYCSSSSSHARTDEQPPGVPGRLPSGSAPSARSAVAARAAAHASGDGDASGIGGIVGGASSNGTTGISPRLGATALANGVGGLLMGATVVGNGIHGLPAAHDASACPPRIEALLFLEAFAPVEVSTATDAPPFLKADAALREAEAARGDAVLVAAAEPYLGGCG